MKGSTAYRTSRFKYRACLAHVDWEIFHSLSFTAHATTFYFKNTIDTILLPIKYNFLQVFYSNFYVNTQHLNL